MSKLQAILQCKCPNCHKGPLFLSPNPFQFGKKGRMHKNCPVCGQDFEIEPGFYFGAAYVSYAINVALFAPLFLVNILFWRFSLKTALLVFVPLFLLLTPVIYRLSRTIWLHIFVRRKE